MLAKHNIKSTALPSWKIYSYLPTAKDALGLRMLAVYSIPRECGKVYIGQSGRSIKIRIKQHNIHMRLAKTNNQQ